MLSSLERRTKYSTVQYPVLYLPGPVCVCPGSPRCHFTGSESRLPPVSFSRLPPVSFYQV